MLFLKGLVERLWEKMKAFYFRMIILLILITWISELNIDIVKPLQTEATFIVGCYKLQPFAHPVACCFALLGFAAQSMKRSNFWVNNSQHFFCSVIVEASRNNVGSVCTALLTFLGPRALITKGFQRLMAVSHPRCNAGPNIVGICCIRLHTTANTDATTSNIVGPVMLKVVTSVCKKLKRKNR